MIQNNLEEARRKHGRGINQAQLARQLGVSRSYMSKLERGRVTPSSEILFKAAAYFALPVEDLFSYVPEES